MDLDTAIKWLTKCSPMDGSDFADACDYAADLLVDIQKWATRPSGIKDIQHRAGYEHAQHDVYMKLL